MRLLGLAFILLFAAACSNPAVNPQAEPNLHGVTFQGAATQPGTLVFTVPERIQIDVTSGASAVEVALQLREVLVQRDYEVLCLVDEGARGTTLLVHADIALSSEESALTGISRGVNEVIQRKEGVESTVNNFLHYLTTNNADRLRNVTTPSFYEEAAQDLGEAITLVSTGRPFIGCRTASVVAELQLADGRRQQVEFQLMTEREPSWRVDGVVTLIEWVP